MYSLIMAGGIGKRFWPRSRRSKPKQLLDIVSSASMLRLTYNRLKNISEEKKIYVVANTGLKDSILSELNEMPASNYITEPSGKNTAPCIGLAAAMIAERDPDAVIGVFPADHLIRDTEAFRRAVQTGYQVARDHDALVTFGIRPTCPATGYGYIQLNQKKPILDDTAFKVKTFAEKPNLETAERFLKSGEFLWNSGMFIWRAQTILNALRMFLPELYSSLQNITKAISKPTFECTLKKEWAAVSGDSIDYGVMEKAKNVYVVRGNFDWSDVGSWDSVYETREKDKDGNLLFGENLVFSSEGNYIYSEKGIVAAIGVRDLIIIQTKDALLVVNRHDSERVKEVVDYLEREKRQEYL